MIIGGFPKVESLMYLKIRREYFRFVNWMQNWSNFLITFNNHSKIKIGISISQYQTHWDIFSNFWESVLPKTNKC